MLVNLNEVLIPARKMGYAIGSFNVYSLETIQVIFEAAAALHLPVIIAFREKDSTVADLQLIASCVQFLANRTSLPVVLHLDHCKSEKLIIKAIQAGFTSVMYDGSNLKYLENLKKTLRITEIAHTVEVTVEAELGNVPAVDEDLAIEEGQLTKSKEAKRFVEETGCDALAVAVGTIHGNYRGKPKIYHERLKEIASVVSVPLVLHGGSGNTEEDLLLAIEEGVAKININTEISNAGVEQLNKIFKDGYSGHLSNISEQIKRPMYQVVKEKMSLFARGRIGI